MIIRYAAPATMKSWGGIFMGNEMGSTRAPKGRKDQVSLVGRSSGITQAFDRSRWHILTDGLRDPRTAEPLCVFPHARSGSAALLGLAVRIRARSIALQTSFGRSGASPHQKSDPKASQYSSTPMLQHSARKDSRTRTTTSTRTKRLSLKI
jgi:hypothetical protein